MGILKFIESVCVQDAVYWSAPSRDGFGKVNYTAEQIKCRWDGSTEIITNRQGEVINSRARLMVVEDLDEEGYLYLGKKDDLSEAELADPLIVPKAYPIQRKDRTPLFKSKTEFANEIYL